MTVVLDIPGQPADISVAGAHGPNRAHGGASK